MAERQAKQEADAKRVEAEKQQRRAEAGEKLAGERLVQVESEKMKAEEEKQIAVAVRDFLQKKLLGQADVTAQADALLAAGGPSAAAKKDPTIRELLDRAAGEISEAKIDANFPNQPLLQAEILKTVGDTYRGVGESERAIGFLQRSLALRKAKLGPEHPDTLDSMDRPRHGVSGCRESGPGPAALRGDAQAQKSQARTRISRHAHQHEQPRRGVSGCREAGPGPAALRADTQARESQARPRASRHAHEHGQPRLGVSGCREAGLGPAALRGDAQAPESQRSAPSIPTLS